MSLPQVSGGDCPCAATALRWQCHPWQLPLLPFRKSNVSSGAVHPTWAPFRSTVAAEERLRFSLRLMDGGCSPGGLVSPSSLLLGTSWEPKSTPWGLPRV